MPLEQELATFEQELPHLLRTLRGKFVLIHKDAIDSSWDTEDEAYLAGCQRFGVEPFLIMLVEDPERPVPLPYDVPPYAPDQQPA